MMRTLVFVLIFAFCEYPIITWAGRSNTVCSCNADSNSQFSSSFVKSPVCAEILDRISKKTFDDIDRKTSSWNWANGACKRNEEAFRQSLIQQGNAQGLVEFQNKLEKCHDQNGDDPISIAVLGGSVTRGFACHGHFNDVETTNLLDLPDNLTIPVGSGSDDCPWGNVFYKLLKSSYPKCKHIDVYNLAHSATNQVWALKHIGDIFSKENGARGGKKLGDVVDLVVVAYSANEGLASLDSPLSEMGFITEFLIKLLLSLPSHPAVMYLEDPSPRSDLDPILYHMQGASHFHVPLASVKHVLSYPDNPTWISFSNDGYRIDYNQSRRPPSGKLYQNPDFNTVIPTNKKEIATASVPKAIIRKLTREEGLQAQIKNIGQSSRPRAKEEEDSNDGVSRPLPPLHSFIQCWGTTIHPGPITHGMMAMILYYFIEVVVKLEKEKLMAKCESNAYRFRVRDVSSGALKLRSSLDSRYLCPLGNLRKYDSQEIALHQQLYEKSASLYLPPGVVLSPSSGWRFIEDRPGKFGFVIQKSSSVNMSSMDYIEFDIKLSQLHPLVTIDYMHTYENAGKVEVSISQQNSRQSDKSTKVQGGQGERLEGLDEDGIKLITPSSSVVIDAFQPEEHYSSVTQFQLRPSGYQEGIVTLRVLLLPLSKQELANRGGNKFKIENVASC